jgi:hypothetical protein
MEPEDEVGVGPHPLPWPDDPRLDPELLAGGDRRNVVDRYRYRWHDAIVADLDSRRHDFHVGIEDWRHDLNIGTVAARHSMLAKPASIRTDWPGYALPEKRAYIEEVLAAVIVHPWNGRRGWNPDRLEPVWRDE